MLSLMIAGQKLGQNIVPVMEKYSEFTDVKGLAFSTGYMSQLGVRVRLATRGAGRWAESSGTNSKFGLNVAELMRMVNELEASGQQSKLVLLALPHRQPDRGHPGAQGSDQGDHADLRRSS